MAVLIINQGQLITVYFYLPSKQVKVMVEDLVYQEIIAPENFYKNFRSKSEFEHWLKLGSKEDLEAALKRFEEAEMYEQCSIIKNFINKNYN